MKTKRIHGRLGAVGLALAVFWTGTVSAQTFSSGSTGALGVFNPALNTTVTLPPDGILNYTTVTIPSGVTVTFTKNAASTPVTMLATGDVTIGGTISLNGSNGIPTGGSTFNVGGSGGPGGFDGGNGGLSTGGSGSAGKGPGGGASAPDLGTAGSGGSYGPPSTFVSLLPLFGGSGAGGGQGCVTGCGILGAGASAGGGGGAIVIASSTKITMTGTITARGGGATNSSGCGQGGGTGSGGAIRLVAPEITGAGVLNATAGSPSGCSGLGGPGLTRLEAFTLGFTGTSTPAASLSTSPSPVTPASNPALVNLPTLTISSVGGVAPPATPGGAYTIADVSLPSGTTNPVPVTIAAANTPVGTVFTVRLIPQFNARTVLTAATTGTFATSTATVNVTFPTGEVSVLNTFGSFTLPIQTAALFPLIDGEPVEQIMVAANYGEASTLSLVTKSGKQMPVSQLSQAGQLKAAMAFEAMRNTN